MALKDCHLVDLPQIADSRGNLTFLEGGRHIPFDIRRIYYVTDIPENAERGSHSHRELQQLIVALNGRFRVELDDGTAKATYTLDTPNRALYVCPMTWRRLDQFSDGAICMVLASLQYDVNDYCRDYEQFLRLVNARR